MENFSEIVVSAVRYALGRRTYIVSLTVDFVMNNIDEIETKSINTMINDIENAENLGDACDKLEWQKLLNFLNGIKKNERASN